MCDHILAHIIGPLKDLRTNIHKEGVGRPPAKDHDLVDWVVVEEERQCAAGMEGVGPEVSRAEAKGLFATAEAACVSDLSQEVGA